MYNPDYPSAYSWMTGTVLLRFALVKGNPCKSEHIVGIGSRRVLSLYVQNYRASGIQSQQIGMMQGDIRTVGGMKDKRVFLFEVC